MIIFLALTPFVALEMALDGEPIRGMVMLILGIPMFYLLTKMSLNENREIRRFRRRLRVDHPWLYAVGVVTRLGFIALVGLAGSIDLLYFDASLWPVVQVTVGLLVIGSMLSLGISGACRAIMSSGS